MANMDVPTAAMPLTVSRDQGVRVSARATHVAANSGAMKTNEHCPRHTKRMRKSTSTSLKAGPARPQDRAASVRCAMPMSARACWSSRRGMRGEVCGYVGRKSDFCCGHPLSRVGGGKYMDCRAREDYRMVL